MTAIKPLQSQCSSCRRRQTVPADRIWYVTVKQGAGSHRAAGWTCRECGEDNVTPPNFLPKGMLGQLPSKEKVQERLALKNPPIPPAIVVPSGPVWAVGADARAILIDALRRMEQTGGDALAMGTVDGRFEPIEVNSIPMATHITLDPASCADLLLAELEQANADMLMLGGTAATGPWQVVLHARSGAASFT